MSCGWCFFLDRIMYALELHVLGDYCQGGFRHHKSSQIVLFGIISECLKVITSINR